MLLANSLSGDLVSGLRGDGFALERVAFQTTAHPVDDFEVVGRADDDEVVRWLVAVRRAPRLVPSDEKSVALIGTFLRVVEREPEALRCGERRLVLVVSGPHRQAAELGELAEFAVDSDTAEVFRAQAANTGRPVRERLKYFDQVVASAAAGIGT